MSSLHWDWYRQLRFLLFQLPPEVSHHLVLKALDWLPESCFKCGPITQQPIEAMGLLFPHPVGLAAGLDKNATHLNALAKLGFSFIEVGTVTPRPQSGNPKPRLFRVPAVHALINRMGFNNVGVHQLVSNIRAANYQGLLGINIGKNKNTPINQAVEDYRYCFRVVYPYASYITVNVSSPNTPDLRQLQQGDSFVQLMTTLVDEQQRLTDKHQKQVPLVVKLSPDESLETYQRMAAELLKHRVAGIIATNTSSGRPPIVELAPVHEEGGLSGEPLREKSLHCLQILKQEVGNAITLIGSGGIDSVAVAQERLDAGATLVQLYTGLIYEGPTLVEHLVSTLRYTPRT